MSNRKNLKLSKSGECPSCGTKGKPILYGLVLKKPSDDIVIGGCCISGDDNNFFCEACDEGFAPGGRRYQTLIEVQREKAVQDTGYTKTVEEIVDLTALSDGELISLAANVIEARHELLHRDFSEVEMSLLALQGGWKSFPMEAVNDLWFYWNPRTKIIAYAAQFFAEGVKHIHGIYRPDRENPSRLRRLADFEAHFMRTLADDYQVWNLKAPISRYNSRTVLDLELMQIMRSGSKVSENLLHRYANPVPDGQMWPAWYDPKQEFLD